MIRNTIHFILVFFFSLTLNSQNVLGIDVSHHQGSINWSLVKNAGKKFSWVKATEGYSGNGSQDPNFTTNMTNGLNDGVIMGAYHFARPDNNTPEQDAQNFLNVAKDYIGNGFLPPVIDIENIYSLTTGQLLHDFTQEMSISELTNWVQSWINVVESETGVAPIIYANRAYAKHFNSSITNYGLWIAAYHFEPNNPPTDIGPWNDWTFFQYTDLGTVSGINGNVDLNVFNGSETELNDLINNTNGNNCNPPTNLNIYNITQTTATFNWSLSNADGYEIELRASGDSWVPIASTTQTATSWSLSGLNSNTEYEVRIKGICNNGTEVSNWVYVSFTTANNNCNPPTNLNITAITETTVTFNWSLSNALGYEIEYRIVGGSWIPAASTTQTATSWNLSGLNSNTEYEVRIKGICSGGRESNWAYVSFTTDGVNNNAPANDNCNDAITLTSSTSCTYTTGTVEDATPSFGANNCLGCSCTSPDDYDVYYKFIAVETSHTVTVSNYASNFDAVIELRTACASGTTNYISCYDPSGAPTSVSETWNGLTKGQTYYIRVFEWNYQGTPPNADTFDICVTHQNINTDGIDLISDITSVSNDNPDAGDSITVNYTITNNGDVTMTSNTTSALYLSSNQTYGSSDILITGSIYGLTTNLSPNQSINLSPTVTLPNVSDGQYYIISYPDLPNLITENDNDNNTDAYAIQIGDVVTNGPDLDVRDVDVIPNSNLIPGQEVDIEVRIENKGTEDVGSFEVLVYFDINGNNNYDGANEYMGEFTFNSLDAGEDDTMTVDFDLPINIFSTGTYEIFAIADSNNEINETNENNNDDDQNVTIGYVYNGSNDDVIILNQTVTPTSVTAGDDVFATANHVYLGSQLDTNVPTLDLGYYLSTDCILSIDDILLNDDSSSLGSDDPIHEEDQTLTIPLGTPSGNYFILFAADIENEVDEGVLENNNVECVEITVNNSNTPEGDIFITDETCNPSNVLVGNHVGSFINVNYSGNVLDANIPSLTINYYLSNDCTLSDDDIFLEDSNTSVGSDNPINGEVYNLELPNNLTPGTYFIISLVDAENELYEIDENNNVGCSEFQVFSSSSTYQDVTLSNPYVAVTEANAGDIIYISVFQNYTGYQTQSEIGGSVRVQYYLSTDCLLSSDDVYLEDDPSTIGSTDSSDFEFKEVTIPSGTSAGMYYILFFADGENIVAETDEDNNVECVPITINDGALSVDDSELNSKIKVYPNPVSNILTINLGEIHSKINLEIFNAIGQRVNLLKFDNKQTLSVNTSSLSSGIYFFKIKTDSINSVEFKIIKE